MESHGQLRITVYRLLCWPLFLCRMPNPLTDVIFVELIQTHWCAAQCNSVHNVHEEVNIPANPQHRSLLSEARFVWFAFQELAADDVQPVMTRWMVIGCRLRALFPIDRTTLAFAFLARREELFLNFVFSLAIEIRCLIEFIRRVMHSKDGEYSEICSREEQRQGRGRRGIRKETVGNPVQQSH